MRKMRSVGLLLAVFIVSANAAFAGIKYPLPPPPDLDPWGGGGNDACAACVSAAYARYTSTVKETCNSFPVNLFGWTTAICVSVAQNVLAQDLVNCATDVCP